MRWLKGLILGASLAAAFCAGWHMAARRADGTLARERAERAAEQSAWEAQANLLKARAAQVNERVVAKYLEGAERARTVTREVIHEVPSVVPAEYDARCPLPGGWVRLHDAAAAGVLPGPPCEADGGPSPVVPSAALATVAANYGTCHEVAARLRALQEWVLEQQALASQPVN